MGTPVLNGSGLVITRRVTAIVAELTEDYTRRLIMLLLGGSLCMASSLVRAEDRLFQGDDLLEVTLNAPLANITRKRDKSMSSDATLRYRTVDGESGDLDVQVKVRGNNRLRPSVCIFPPLRVLFRRNQLEGTIFENQERLKLVVQCDPFKTRHEYALFNEYLAYRILNLITPKSFRVRLARIDYEYSDRPARSRTDFAFFLEDKDRLADRLGVKPLSLEQTSAVDLDSSHLNKTSLFQLLIGNVDWSATSVAAGDCCHNYKLFEQQGADILSIPYDFDLAGLVNAEYAKPDTEMGLKTVRQRRYRGYCRNNHLLDEHIGLFNEKKSAIMALVQEFPHLPPKERQNSASYLEGFYRIINKPQRVKRVILKRCHKSYFVEVAADREN